MINYNKNKLINQALDKYYDTFAHMLDTTEYVPQKYNDKVGKYIFKNMKKQFKLIDKEDRKYQREIKKKIKLKNQEMKKKEKALKPKKVKFKLFKKFFSKLFKRKNKD